MKRMDKQPKLPVHVLACGEALRPVLAKVSAALRTPLRPQSEIVTLDAVQDHLSRVANASDGFVAEANDLG